MTRLAAALVGLLLLTALPFPLVVAAEGGAQPLALVTWHGLVVAILSAVLLFPGRDAAAQQSALAGGASLGFALFVLVVLLEALIVPYWLAAWLLLVELSAFAAVAWLAARCAPRLSRLLAWPLAAAAALQGLLVAWQRVENGIPRPPGTFLNPNHLAAWIVAVLLIFWGQAFVAGMRRRELGLRAAVSAPALLGLVLTGSRGALLGLCAGGLALGLMTWGRVAPATRRGLLVAAGLLALLAGGIALGRVTDGDPFRYHRLQIWRASLELFLESPWTGSGPGQFDDAARNFQFPDGEGPLRYDKSFSSPHSDVVRVPAEFGLAGALALALTLGLAVLWLIARKRHAAWPVHVVPALGALTALAAQALVDDLSHRPALYLLAAVLAGSVLSDDAATVRLALSRPSCLALAVLLLAAFAAGDVAPYLAWQTTAQLPRGRLRAEDERRLARAIAWNPLHPDLWLRHAEHVAGDGSDWDLDRYAQARESMERAVRLHAAGAAYERGLGRVEALACRTLFRDQESRTRAQAAFLRAGRLARFDPFIPLELGAFLIDTGDPHAARRQAERALALEPESVAPRLLLADALLEIGGAAELARSRELLAEAQELAARWEAVRNETSYASQLLSLSPTLLARIERKAAALEGALAARPAGAR